MVAKISPLKTQKNSQTDAAKKDILGNQFYSAASNQNEKVVVCSVITSARPEQASLLEEEKNAYQRPSNYIPLRYKPNAANLSGAAVVA